MEERVCPHNDPGQSVDLFTKIFLHFFFLMQEKALDCFSCKLVGAGGCFAASVYVAYERAKLPLQNRNRHWLTAICVATAGLGVARLLT